MARIEPRFDVQMWNDPAASVGVRVEDVMTMQYDGYLVGALIKGAGVEGAYLHFSDGQEDQHISGRDIAIDADTQAMERVPGPGNEFNGFIKINAPLAKGTKISITEQGTGTAECNLWCLFSLTPTGPYVLNKAVLVDVENATYGDTLMDCPTFMSQLKRTFIRGNGANDLTIALGAGGQTIVIPCRAIAINTDSCPHAHHSIDSQTPDKIIFVAMNGFVTTDAWLYFQFE